MSKYCLVGVDGNAISIMGYTARALRNEGLGDKVEEMYEKATSGTYTKLLIVCDDYIQMANAKAEENGYVDDDE